MVKNPSGEASNVGYFIQVWPRISTQELTARTNPASG